MFLIFTYLDPYRNELISLITLTTTFILLVTSFSTLILYIFKKVYYRGEVFLSHIFSSLRQGVLLSLFLIGIIIFKIIGVFGISTISLLLIITLFIELMFENL
ncbi:MAG: hypothetical protein PHE25_01270 [Candidatus Gracilibacteria bacterium]|nr:hypothetical protein [Candidatus Gracilibacteria bacterium]